MRALKYLGIVVTSPKFHKRSDSWEAQILREIQIAGRDPDGATERERQTVALKFLEPARPNIED